MKSLSINALAALLSVTGTGLAQTIPYYETAPVTLLWQFNDTLVSTVRTVEKPGTGNYVEDPTGLKVYERITTETGKLAPYPTAKGNQEFFVKHLLRNVLERYAEDSKFHLNAALDADKVQDNVKAAAERVLAIYDESQIQTIKHQLSDQWELTSVRQPHTSLNGVVNDEFRLFVTRIDPFNGRLLHGYDTEISLIPKYSTAKATETLNGGTVTKASGTVTAYFTLKVIALYADDPLYLVPFDSRAAATDYNTAGEWWLINGGGTMSYSIRSTVGPGVAVLPTRVQITGYGSWEHEIFTVETSRTYSGIAPLNIRMGEVKYQRSEYFPELFPLE
jgi:hypothetical protein